MRPQAYLRDLLTFYVEGDKTGIGMENAGRSEPTPGIGSGRPKRSE